MRERCKADAAAAVDHLCRLIDAVGCGRTLDHIVDTLAAHDLVYRLDRVFLAYIDDMVGTQLLADFKPVVAGAGQDNRLRTHRLGHGHAHQADGAGSGNDHAFTGNQSAQFGEAIHGSAGSYHQRRLFVRHVVIDVYQRVDVVDLVFAETAVGGEAVGPMALVHVTIVLAVIVA